MAHCHMLALYHEQKVSESRVPMGNSGMRAEKGAVCTMGAIINNLGFRKSHKRSTAEVDQMTELLNDSP